MNQEEARKIATDFHQSLNSGDDVIVKKYSRKEILMALNQFSPQDQRHLWYKAMLDRANELKTKKEEDEKEYNILKERFITSWDGSARDQKQYKCLVIMPIGKQGTIQYKNNMHVFEDIISKCVKNCGYSIHCYHSDLINQSGAIDRQVIKGLRDDDIVIADLRMNNVNVTYELGIRHTFGKRSILVCSDQDKHLFFYTKRYRAIPYKIDGTSNQDFFKRLKDQIDDIIKNPSKSDNPVADAIGHIINPTQSNKKETLNKYLYLSRKQKGTYMLCNVYNLSNDDLVDVNINLEYIDKNGQKQQREAKIINSFDDPLKARPYKPSLIKKKEDIDISNFPRVPTNVLIKGKIADSGEHFQEEFRID